MMRLEKSLVNYERSRKRKRKVFKSQAAKIGNCKLIPVLINDNQLLTLTKLYSLIDTYKTDKEIEVEIDLDHVIYWALRLSIADLKSCAIKLRIPSIERHDLTCHPEDHDALINIKVKAQQLFEDWEQCQTKEFTNE